MATKTKSLATKMATKTLPLFVEDESGAFCINPLVRVIGLLEAARIGLHDADLDKEAFSIAGAIEAVAKAAERRGMTLKDIPFGVGEPGEGM